jgi:hypothetical protein
LLRNGAEGVLAALKEMFVVKGIKTK